MEESNLVLKDATLEAVDNQLVLNDPPEVNLTLKRLIKEGHSSQEAKELIAAVLAGHMFYILKNNNSYDNSQYVEDLENLPKLPSS